MSLAMVFPGQGSQSVGMLSELAETHDSVKATFAEASNVLGYDLWQRVQDGPAEKLAETTVTQPAMLAAGVATWRVWIAEEGEVPTQVAGHSLGEYSALVAANAVSLEDAMKVVKRRSELMQDAVPAGVGAMAALLGLEDEKVTAVCAEAAGDEVCEAVNFNSPGQVVIAGHRSAVDRAIALAQDAGAKRALMLPVSVPAHSALMREAGEALSISLAEAEFSAPDITVVSASDGRPYGDGDDIRERLSRQVYSPVQWVQTIEALVAGGADRVYECGPGKVLAGLVRRISRGTAFAAIESPDSLNKAMAN